MTLDCLGFSISLMVIWMVTELTDWLANGHLSFFTNSCRKVLLNCGHSPPRFVLNFLFFLSLCPLFLLSILESLALPPHWWLCRKSDRSHELRAHISAGISNLVCLKIKSVIFTSSTPACSFLIEPFRSFLISELTGTSGSFSLLRQALRVSSVLPVWLCLSVLTPCTGQFRRPLSRFSPVMLFSDSCVMLPTVCLLKDTYCFVWSISTEKILDFKK